MRAHAIVLASLMIVLGLAGCTTDDVPQGDDVSALDPVVHRSPDDDANLSADEARERSHVHDYWGAATVLTVLDQTAGSRRLSGGPPAPVMNMRPDEGDVFPQGARWVNITVSWTDSAPTNHYTDPRLYVKTAADADVWDAGPIENGGTFTLEVANAQNDLPHQVLSAWEFELWMAQPDGPRFLDYDGDVTMRVVAERGHELPVFPPHGDPWNGTTERDLLSEVQDSATLWVRNGNNNMCLSCPSILVKFDEGAIVPLDADHVEVTVSHPGSPLSTDLYFHGADTRRFARVAADQQTGGVLTYRIPVEGLMGDGPYALHSQWELLLVPDEEAGDAYTGDLEVAARVLRVA